MGLLSGLVAPGKWLLMSPLAVHYPADIVPLQQDDVLQTGSTVQRCPGLDENKFFEAQIPKMNRPSTSKLDDKEGSETKKVINVQIDTKGFRKRFVYLTRQVHNIQTINKLYLRPLSTPYL